MATFRFEKVQEISSSIKDVWNFIANPRNLKLITPPYMDFNILTPNLPDNMYPGMMIEYSVKPVMGISMYWLTEITQVKEFSFFVDEQRSGPYTLWHHEHRIEPTENGVLMTDVVHYIPPFGILGSLANRIFIQNQLNAIFDYRTKAIERQFPDRQS